MLDNVLNWTKNKYRWCLSQNWLMIIFFVSIYQLALWGAHILFISFASYIHFLLDHRLATIEEWIFFNGWEITILSKSIVTFLFLKFLLVASSDRSPVLEVLKKGMPTVTLRFLLSLIPMVAIYFVLGRPVSQQSWDSNFVAMIMSFLGHVIFYASDGCIVYLISKNYQLRRIDKILVLSILPPLVFALHKATYLYASDWGLYSLSLTFLISYLALGTQDNWKTSSAFSLFVIAPLGAFVGVDPIWSKNFSPFVFSRPITSEVIAIVMLMLVVYWEKIEIGPIRKGLI